MILVVAIGFIGVEAAIKKPAEREAAAFLKFVDEGELTTIRAED